MEHIVAVRVLATAPEPDHGPTIAELQAIERESPLILAELDLLDPRITVLDRVLSVLDARRARNRVMAARRDLTDRTTTANLPGVWHEHSHSG
jgi:hypothetical protein